MPPRTDSFEGLHVLLVTEDDARAQAIAKALRERKAHVGDVRAGSKDPVALRGADLLVIDARRGAATEARVAEVRSDVRARWASVATIDYTTLASGDGTIDLRALEGIVTRLAGMDKALTERARKEASFDTLLAPLGPTRTLRALALAGPTLHVELTDGTLKASVDLADELLVSAFAERDGERYEAWLALARVLGMTDATVSVQRRAHPTAMNIMEPVDQALEMAAQERARVPEVFAREEQDQAAELSGLHREPQRQGAPAAESPLAQPQMAVHAEAPLAAAQGEPTASRAMPPRSRTLAGIAPPPGAAAFSEASAPRPSMPRPSAPRPPPARPSVPRPSSPMRDQFADVPTDPAAPGLLRRMARSPANDVKLPEVKLPEPKPATEPQLSYDTLPSVRAEDDDDANEVTVIADASQLNILRETLERIDEPEDGKPLTSTMPAPAGAKEAQDAEAEIELVRSASAKIPLPPPAPLPGSGGRRPTTPTPAEQAAAASAFGSIPPPAPQALQSRSVPVAPTRQPAAGTRTMWYVLALLAVLAIALGVYFSNRTDAPDAPAPAGQR